MRMHAWFAMAAVAALFVGVTSARAGECKDAAKGEFRDCRTTCVESFQASKDGCLNRDHACVEACRGGRADCVDASGVEAALKDCDTALREARKHCPAPGDPGRDACVDQAQVVAFQCRDSAREAAKAALKACKRSFRTCAYACGPATTSVNVKQCRVEAKTSYRTCNADCIEGFQVTKDACRSKSHSCVEGCRDARSSCDQPVRDQLDAAVTACKAARDAAVTTCKQLYADGTPERDQCIDNAQVVAFVCRDDAHEAAQPGFRACQQAFVQCVTACPASPSGAFVD